MGEPPAKKRKLSEDLGTERTAAREEPIESENETKEKQATEISYLHDAIIEYVSDPETIKICTKSGSPFIHYPANGSHEDDLLQIQMIEARKGAVVYFCCRIFVERDGKFFFLSCISQDRKVKWRQFQNAKFEKIDDGSSFVVKEYDGYQCYGSVWNKCKYMYYDVSNKNSNGVMEMEMVKGCDLKRARDGFWFLEICQQQATSKPSQGEHRRRAAAENRQHGRRGQRVAS